MEGLDYRFSPGLRRRSQWTQSLREVFHTLSDALRVPCDDSERARLESLLEVLSCLVYAQALTQIQIRFADVVVRIHVSYALDDATPDEFDFSILTLVEWQIDKLDVWFVVEDKQYADSLIGSWAASEARDDAAAGLVVRERERYDSNAGGADSDPRTVPQNPESEAADECAR